MVLWVRVRVPKFARRRRAAELPRWCCGQGQGAVEFPRSRRNCPRWCCGSGSGCREVPHTAACWRNCPRWCCRSGSGCRGSSPRRRRAGGIAGDGAVGQGEGTSKFPTPPPRGIARDGAVGQGQGAESSARRRRSRAELPEMVLWVRVRVPPSFPTPPPSWRNCPRWCCGSGSGCRGRSARRRRS